MFAYSADLEAKKEGCKNNGMQSRINTHTHVISENGTPATTRDRRREDFEGRAAERQNILLPGLERERRYLLAQNDSFYTTSGRITG